MRLGIRNYFTIFYKMEERYKEVSLNKLRFIPINKKLELIPQTSESYSVFGYESKNIGWFYNLKEAEEALQKYYEKDSNIFAFEIIGPEHGFGKSDFILNEEDGLYYEIKENEKSDESPKYQFLYDSQKQLLSSYFYDEKNPGGKRLEGEKILTKGDISYVRCSIYLGNDHFDLLIPVEIEGKVSIDYNIQRKIDSLLNIEKDSLIYKPLFTVKCNWGEEPATLLDTASRIDFIDIKV